MDGRKLLIFVAIDRKPAAMKLFSRQDLHKSLNLVLRFYVKAIFM